MRMEMKLYTKTLLILACALSAVSCNDWLREDSPMLNSMEDYMTSEQAAVQVVNAAYAPLMWEYNSTYFSEWFIGDIASDDALKGGQNISDMADAYDIENFKTIANNGLLLNYYRAKYQGVIRANLAIEQVGAMVADETLSQEMKDRLLGEARFLRAFYYFQLVRIFGGVPKIEKPIYSSADWVQPRASLDEIFSLIVSDLDAAQSSLPKKSEYSLDDLGRATSGAAQAMLLKAYLYWGNYKENSGVSGDAEYAEAKEWGYTFMTEQTGEYDLCPKYEDNFTLDGENGAESVFEIQYMDDATSDYGEGNGFTRGTFSTILMRSRSTKSDYAGWGFNKPTQNLYDEYETGDPRRAASIRTMSESDMTNPAEETYLGCTNVTVKRTLTVGGEYVKLSHEARSPINLTVIRLADVYLLYAEACLENDDTGTAKEMLEKVRSRARGTAAILPEFPGYEVPDYTAGYAQHQLQDNPADLELAIRHERRVELAMEGHRWFDITRWGIAKEVMDAYKADETDEARSHMGEFVKGKHELFPIPDEEVRLGGLVQNTGY